MEREQHNSKEDPEELEASILRKEAQEKDEKIDALLDGPEGEFLEDLR